MRRVSLTLICCGLLLSAAACGTQPPPLTHDPVVQGDLDSDFEEDRGEVLSVSSHNRARETADPTYVDLEIPDIELQPERVFEPDIPPIELPDPDSL